MNETHTPTSDSPPVQFDYQGDDDQELFSDRFMAEYTDHLTWERFKLRLASTAPVERDRFVAEHTVFSSWREMEDVALGQMVFRQLDLD